MWELIRANKRKSVWLMVFMAIVLLGLGAIMGGAFGGQQGLIFGAGIAAIVFLIMALVSFSAGDQILLAASGAKKVTKKVHPQLFNVVEEMTIAAGLPKMPDIYIIADQSPNAFATGRSPERASVAVTAGLLGRLNRDELQGVIAHEISHILHRDILYVTVAGIMIGSIVMLSDIFLRSMLYGSLMGGSRRRCSSRSNNDGGAAIMMVIAIVAAIVAPILAYMLYFSLSRRREYLADAGAARLTRYPDGLAGALEKISGAKVPMETANKVTAPMYIAPPVAKDKMAFAGLGSTHPPIKERVKILRNMTHGASLKDYSQSFATVTGGKTVMPVSGLKDSAIDLQQGESSSKKVSQKKQLKQINDIMRMVNGFAFINCGCGLNMKLPGNFNSPSVKCPRCGKMNKVG